MIKPSAFDELSIVIPVYNETRRLEEGLRRIVEYLRARPGGGQIVLVDDGSDDGTVETARRLLADYPDHLIVANRVNRGKGHAVKTGMSAARGRARLFTDIDLSVPIETADIFVNSILNGAHVVIGTRKTRESRVEVHQPFYREWLGGVFRWTSRVVFAPVVTDFTCGFKAFSAEATERIFSQSLIERWSFDTEILFLAYRMKIKIIQVPVRWINSADSRVNLGAAMIKSLWELVQVRINHARGLYRLGAESFSNNSR